MYSREEKCGLLSQNPTLHGFFNVLCADREAIAACWLENDEEKDMTFGELCSAVNRCAAVISHVGCGKQGGWVGLAVETCRYWPVLFWGLVASGRKPLLLDPALMDEALAHLLDQANADTLVTSSRRACLSTSQFIPAELLIPGEYGEAENEWADMLAVCTSGTTATSRVFVYTGEAVCLQAVAIMHQQEGEYVTAESRGPLRTLCFLPLNHIFGFMTNMVWTWMLGYPQVFLRDRAPETIFHTCQKLHVRYITAVPLLLNNVCSRIRKQLESASEQARKTFERNMEIALQMQKLDPVEGLRLSRELFADIDNSLFGTELEQIIIGGSHIPEENLRLINALGYATFCGFGMTEMAITSAECRTDVENRLNGSVGWPMENIDYRVIPDGSDPNHGELWIRSSAMHKGRLVNGEFLPPILNDEGWFETGDVVRMDTQRRTWVVGRIKDIVVAESGENVYPDEIEEFFAGLDGVEGYTVLGVRDASGTERITLVMNVGAGVADREYCGRLWTAVQERNKTLPVLKKVHTVIAVPDPLPVASGIKVRRNLLRQQIEEDSIPFTVLDASFAKGIQTEMKPVLQSEQKEEKLVTDASLKEEIRRTFAEVLHTDAGKIADDAHFIYDLGGDSLSSISLSIKLEEKYNLLIPTEAFRSCVCVNDVTALIDGLLHGETAAKEEKQPEAVTPITRFEDTPEYAAFAKRLEGIEKLESNPYFVCHESPLTDVSLMDGREVLNFGSYNYVGMSGRPEVEEAAIAAIRKYGTSASGSRLLAGEKKVHQELEQAIAKWKHAEAAVVLVGGHSTNVTIVGNFCGEKDLIVYDAIAHNSIAEGCRLSSAVSKPFPHNDVAALEGILRTQRSHFEKVLIVVGGTYSMDGDIAPIPEIVALKKKYGCFLMVDEAHSACVIGKTGGGVDEYFGLAGDDIDIKMGTLSKGLGTCGGYLAGKKCLIDYLRYSLPGFVFSVGISPALAAASLEAIRQLKSKPQIMEDLRRNISVFVEEAHKRNLNTCLAGKTAVIPILVGDDDEAFALSVELGKRGVFVPPAVYPAVPRGKSRLRYCVTSDHQPEQIIRALDILVETAKEMHITLPPMD